MINASFLSAGGTNKSALAFIKLMRLPLPSNTSRSAKSAVSKLASVKVIPVAEALLWGVALPSGRVCAVEQTFLLQFLDVFLKKFLKFLFKLRNE